MKPALCCYLYTSRVKTNGLWNPRGGPCTNGRLSDLTSVQGSSNSVLVSAISQEDGVPSTASKAQTNRAREARRRRAFADLKNSVVRKSIQIDELTETPAIAVREKGELRALLQRKEAQIAKRNSRTHSCCGENRRVNGNNSRSA